MGYYGRTEASMTALESDAMIVVGTRLSDRTITSYDEVIEARKKFIKSSINLTDRESNKSKC